MDKLQRQICSLHITTSRQTKMVSTSRYVLYTQILDHDAVSSYLWAQDRLSSQEVMSMAQHRHANHNRPADVQLA
jgi:hypothetical protein